MRNETIAIHAGYEPDPTTKSVAVPIYQTVAYAFDSADHGAALFNLEADGFRYSRIANPTTSVLEKRITELEGGVGALAVATGQAALHFALVNLADTGGNIVSVPQLYGTTHTLLAHVLPRQGITTRFADSDKADAIEKLIDENTKAIFSETIGNRAGNVCDIEALAKAAHRHAVPLAGDTPPAAFPPSTSPTRPITVLSTQSNSEPAPTSSARAASISAPWDRCFRRSMHSCCCRGSRPSRCGSNGMSRTRVRSRSSCAPISAWDGSIMPGFPTVPIMRWCKNTSMATHHRCLHSASRAAWRPARPSMIR